MGRGKNTCIDENLLPHQRLSTFCLHSPIALVPADCPTAAIPLSYLLPSCLRGTNNPTKPNLPSSFAQGKLSWVKTYLPNSNVVLLDICKDRFTEAHAKVKHLLPTPPPPARAKVFTELTANENLLSQI